jgi:SRSO17 transposase
MLPGERKSVEPRHASARHQSLHHFVAKAEWSDAEMLRRVSQHVVPKMDFSSKPTPTASIGDIRFSYP